MNRRELLSSIIAASLALAPSGATGRDAITRTNEWDVLKDALTEASRYYIFEFNDVKARHAIKTALKPFCDSHGFYMKCDSDNNPDTIIEENKFVIEFYKDGKRLIFTASTSSVDYEEAIFG